MALKASTNVLETFQVLWNIGAIGGLTDAQLLERFLAASDEGSEVAFAVLVERHGPNIRRVCLDLLSDADEAQDTAQAVFLVLARKARSIRKPASLGPWLHGVALRMARRVRAKAARRRQIERRRAEAMAERFHTQHRAEPDRYIELYEEIERLPEKYRNPIVLCYLQGHTQEQASQELGWPLGTIQTRLHRGRERLRSRLSRRGIGLSGMAATAQALPRSTATAALVPVPSGWANATATAAVRFAAGAPTAGLVPPIVVRLAEGALVTMLRETLNAFVFRILFVGVGSLGVALGVRAIANGREPHKQSTEPTAVPSQQAVARAQLVRATPAPRKRTEAHPTAAPSQPAVPRAQLVRATPPPRKRPDVEQRVNAGVRYLEARQRPDGSWPDADTEALTSLVTLALLGAGEPATLPAMTRAIEYLRGFTPGQLHSVYAVSLQTRVFAAADQEQDRPRIASNVEWLERAQIKSGDRVEWPGSWTYNQSKNRRGDNSNTFYALLGLNAASDAGVPVKAEVWTLAGRYWSGSQSPDGGWGYTPSAHSATASMTCGGVVSLILSRTRRTEDQESPDVARFRNCGSHGDTGVRKGTGWLTSNFHRGENLPIARQWRFYFTEAFEWVGQLSGERLFGEHDWFVDGAEDHIRSQDDHTGEWQGLFSEHESTIATSFALMFLCRGRSPVLIQKARHGPGDDWTNDPDDVRHLVRSVAHDWKLPLNWQVVDLDSATASELLLAPILFLNGHQSPELNDHGKKSLRAYVDQGGFIFAEACCGKADFDRGLRVLVQQLFPDAESRLHPLDADHPVWTARHALKPQDHALWGLELGGRTVLIYSPTDLSCRWNVRDRYSDDPATIRAVQVGQNVVAHARSRQAPAQ